MNDPTVDPSELELIWGHVRMEMALLSSGHGSLGESQHSLSSLFHRMIDTDHGYGLDAVTGPEVRDMKKPHGCLQTAMGFVRHPVPVGWPWWGQDITHRSL